MQMSMLCFIWLYLIDIADTHIDSDQAAGKRAREVHAQQHFMPKLTSQQADMAELDRQSHIRNNATCGVHSMQRSGCIILTNMIAAVYGLQQCYADSHPKKRIASAV